MNTISLENKQWCIYTPHKLILPQNLSPASPFVTVHTYLIYVTLGGSMRHLTQNETQLTTGGSVIDTIKNVDYSGYFYAGVNNAYAAGAWTCQNISAGVVWTAGLVCTGASYAAQGLGTAYDTCASAFK